MRITQLVWIGTGLWALWMIDGVIGLMDEDIYGRRSVERTWDTICRRKVKGACQPLQFTICFGVKLPYAMTSPDLVNENFTQQQLHNEMLRWEGLRSSPKCWGVIQPLLCSYYFPNCANGTIDLPSQDMCKIPRTPCKVIEQVYKQWPEFLQCNDNPKFPPSCKNEIEARQLRFNSSGKCMDPMKEIENSFNYYEGFEGCGLKCKDPNFSDEDHDSVSKLIWYFGVVNLLCNGFVILTYLVEGIASSKFPEYPSAIVLYANVWYFIASVGWLFQYLPLGKEDIVCRKDGTLRRNEITGDENIFCAMVSSWIYFSTMSVLAWLMVFAYVWNLTCNSIGRLRQKVDKQRAYFIVWTVAFPTIFTVICLSVGKIDGSSMYGICFVGFFDPIPRIFLVMLPVGISSCVTLFYLFRGAYRLLSVSMSSGDFIPPAGRAKIKSKGFRVIIFSILAVVILVAGLILQIQSIRTQPVFEKSLRESILCKLNLTDVAECGTTEKPDPSLIFGHIIVYFCGGILVSSWAWTYSSWNIWRKRISGFCKSEDSDGLRSQIPKHKLISKAFAQRHDIAGDGRLCLSLLGPYEDPIGLNQLLDPNHLCRNATEDMEQSQQFSQATGGDGQDISNDWAAAIPTFVNRRNALVPPHSSNSVSCVSEDSRRLSCDSAMSEQLAARHLQGIGSQSGLDNRPSRKERFRMMDRHRPGKFFKSWRRRSSNRGSSTSLESNPGSQILPAITKLIDKREQMGDDNMFVLNNQSKTVQQPTKILRELAIQTSIEKLYYPTKAIKQCNLSNNLSVDKATQSSLASLHEIGTQTKKSATKKRNKEKKDATAGTGKDQDVVAPANPSHPTHVDPVLRLLTPN